jgi:hypothetical protein
MEMLTKSPKDIFDNDRQRPLYKHLFLELFAVGYEELCGKKLLVCNMHKNINMQN